MLTSCELPIPVKELPLLTDAFSEQTKEIFSLITTNNAFKNPVNQILTESHVIVTDSISDLTALISSPPPPHTITDINDYITKANNLLVKHEDFMGHTDRLSGVDLISTNNATHDLGTILSVGASSISLEHTLNSVVGNPCGKMLSLFGSLLCGQKQWEDIASFYSSLVSVIEAGEVTAMQLKGQMDAFISSVTTLIDNDRLNIQNYINELKYAALSQLLGNLPNDPCMNYMIKNKLGTDKLLSKL